MIASANSGEHKLPACRFRRLAETNFVMKCLMLDATPFVLQHHRIARFGSSTTARSLRTHRSANWERQDNFELNEGGQNT